MSNGAQRKYHLYVVKPEDISQKERFFLITAKWSLLYTNAKPPKMHREVSDLKELPALASEWIKTTIDTIREEYLKENEQEILKCGKAFTERFELELKAEKEKLEKEAQDA